MFICQKCGWRDFPQWRSHKWQLYSVYCRIDELESFEPDLAKILKEQIEHDDEHGYFYHYAKKSGIVIRIPSDLKQWFKRGHTEEKYKPHNLSKKLTQFLENAEAKL